MQQLGTLTKFCDDKLTIRINGELNRELISQILEDQTFDFFPLTSVEFEVTLFSSHPEDRAA